MTLKRREKILLCVAISAIAIWVFDHFYYTNQKRKISMLKDEIKGADLKMNESSILLQSAETLEKEVSRLETHLRGVSGRTLTGEEFRAFLKRLAADSDRLRMKMVSLTSQEEKISPADVKKLVSASQYKKVMIHMVVHSTYGATEIFLKGMESLPFPVTVEHLKIERTEEILPLLKVTMGLCVLTLL